MLRVVDLLYSLRVSEEENDSSHHEVLWFTKLFTAPTATELTLYGMAQPHTLILYSRVVELRIVYTDGIPFHEPIQESNGAGQHHESD